MGRAPSDGGDDTAPRDGTDRPGPGGRRAPVLPLVLGALLVAAGLGLFGFLLLRHGGDTGDPGSTAPPSVDDSPPMILDLAAVTTAPTTPAGIGEGWAEPVRGRRALRGFGEVAGVVTAPDGRRCEVCLLAALNGEQHQRGLMEVTDRSLGGYDGMLFLFPGEENGSFWMRNTPMPLSIAYLDGGGRPVSILDMEPCEDSPSCPGYAPGRPFRYALEVPRGGFDRLGMEEGSVLQVTGSRCPLAGKASG